jgi:hypothetical protein
VLGSLGNDVITGSAGSNVLLGDAGNDRVWGGRGNDIVWGEAGNDRRQLACFRDPRSPQRQRWRAASQAAKSASEKQTTSTFCCKPSEVKPVSASAVKMP